MEYVAFYKIFCLLVGLAFGYMGYRLFMVGIWGSSGDVDASFGEIRLLIKKAAPGSFFAIFGAIIVGFTIFRGYEIHDLRGREEPSNEKPEIPKESPIGELK
ncbi:hypothetical protein [Alcanivorax sp.]|uniref:hypothetical protein n=1 Tax=Alcanivorax sp. TaxID=1872427 RepID=UPI002B269FF0|nr:hypothetical protein [Alcanivorax sp.]